MKSFILPFLHDIRHRTPSGELDLERITQGDRIVDLRLPGAKHAIVHDEALVRLVKVLEQVPRRLELPVREIDPSAVDRAVAVALQRHRESTARGRHVLWRAQRRKSEKRFKLIEPVRPPAQEPALLTERTPARTLFGIQRSFAFTMVVAAVLVPSLAFAGSLLSLRRSLVASMNEAALRLEAATVAMASLDAEGAEGAFADAQQVFHDAQAQLFSTGFGIVSLLAEVRISAQLTTGKALLTAGEEMAAAGEEMSRALAFLDMFSPEAILAALTVPTQGSVPVGTEQFEDSLTAAAAHLSAAADALQRVDVDAVPDEYRARVERLQSAIPAVRLSVTALEENAHALSGILGMAEPRRYLVLLQNSSELRPTGGFIGNIAIATVVNGRVIGLRVEDTYLFDGQIVDYTVPPKPLQDISTAWSLHDANWFRDFPTTARIASEFFEEAGPATPDGVIAFTSRFFERLLSVVGPVTTEEGLTIDAASFTDTLNAIGAAQRPGETTQVRTVSSLLPALLKRLAEADGEESSALLETLRASIAAGDFQVWFRDAQEQQLISRFGLAGELPKTSGDFLALVYGNINGFKTDRVIGEAVQHEAVIAGDGSIVDTVTITRHHHGDELEQPFYRAVNKTYLRLLVPRGAELLSVEGVSCKPQGERKEPFVNYEEEGYRIHPIVAAVETTVHRFADGCVDIGEENGRTSFGAWLFMSPGESIVVRFVYRLPFRLTGEVDSYRLFVLKQPGWESAFAANVRLAPPWRIVWNDDSFLLEADGVLASEPEALVQNRFFSAVFAR